MTYLWNGVGIRRREDKANAGWRRGGWREERECVIMESDECRELEKLAMKFKVCESGGQSESWGVPTSRSSVSAQQVQQEHTSSFSLCSLVVSLMGWLRPSTQCHQLHSGHQLKH